METSWKTSLCWGLYCVNDNAVVDLENAQIICCILCHKNLVTTKIQEHKQEKN
jgi:hypothetical protein